MKSWIVSLVVLLGFTVVQPSTSAADVNSKANSPSDEVKATVDEIVKAVALFPSEGQTKERRAKLREIISPRFDFEEMSKRSLGPNWENCTPEDRKEFVRLFSELLARTYLGRIEHVKADMVKIDGEDILTPSSAKVRTTVKDKGNSFPIDYRLIKQASGWRVYDVIIEQIGLVQNYRNEFASIIRKDQFAGLLKQLKTKVGE